MNRWLFKLAASSSQSCLSRTHQSLVCLHHPPTIIHCMDAIPTSAGPNRRTSSSSLSSSSASPAASISSGEESGGSSYKKRPRRFDDVQPLKAFIRRAQVLGLYRSFLRVSLVNVGGCLLALVCLWSLSHIHPSPHGSFLTPTVCRTVESRRYTR